MSRERNQRAVFVATMLCLVATFLAVVTAPTSAWVIWAAAVGFCVVSIYSANSPGSSGRR